MILRRKHLGPDHLSLIILIEHLFVRLLQESRPCLNLNLQPSRVAKLLMNLIALAKQRRRGCVGSLLAEIFDFYGSIYL